jgi:hypothetical protein
MAKIFEIKASLVGINPEIYRTFRVDSSINLQILHEVFQALFGWENFHLHFYRDAKGGDVPVKKEDQVLLSEVLAIGHNLTYIYDYGDSWTIDLTLLNSFDDSTAGIYPICIGGLRKAPPEDSGGITGYEIALELIKSDKKKAYTLISEWYGDDYDPEYFNLEEINKALYQLRR